MALFPSDMAVKGLIPNGLAFASPTRPEVTAKVVQTTKPKLIAGVQVNNYVAEFVLNQLSDVTVGANSIAGVDAQSARFRFSGSSAGMADLKELALAGIYTLIGWVGTENFLEGFDPTSLPIPYPPAP